ncbi:MAG: lipopolysaccharide biosynthesis protein [bacterium]
MAKGLKPIINQLFPERIFRDSAKVLVGQMTGHAIIFLSGPLLSRLYSPEEFGTYALMSSIAALLSIISTGGYEFAIINVKEDKEAQVLSILSISGSLITAIIAACILLFLTIKTEAIKNGMAGAGWGLLPAFVLFQGIYNTANFTLNRQKKYETISFARTLRALAMVPIQLFLGGLNFAFGLFLGMVSGHMTGMLFQLRKIYKQLIYNIKIVNFKKLKTTALKNYKFPAFFMPEELINSASVQAPIFLLKFFFNQASIGLYALPQKLLSIPIVLIGNSLGQIYFRNAALEYTNPDKLLNTTLRLFRYLFFLGLLPFSFLMVYGDIIVPYIFGDEWYESGIYTMILSPWLFFVLIGSPLSNIFPVKGKQKLSLTINLYMLTGRILAFMAGVFLFENAIISVALFSGISFCFWFFIAFYNLYLVKARIRPEILKVLSIWFLNLLIFFLIRKSIA